MLDQVTEQETTQDIGDALRRTAMLAAVSITTWSATVSDEGALTDLKAQKNATGNVGKFMKNLLAGADSEYKALKSSLEGARALHYKMTLPWVAHDGDRKGPRLLPNVTFMKYMQEMKAQEGAIVKAKEAFREKYPQAITTAMQNLGDLGEASRYPDVDKVLDQFKLHVDISPIPTGSDFKGLPPNLIYVLNNNMQRRTETMVGKAMAEVWTQVRDNVTRMVDRFAPNEKGEAKIFHASTIENAKELVELLNGFNITQDPRIVEVQADLRGMLAGITAETVRTNDALRGQLQQQASAVQSKLQQWGV